VSFAAITICVTSQRMFILVVYFIMDSVRKLFVYTLVKLFIIHKKIIVNLWDE